MGEKIFQKLLKQAKISDTDYPAKGTDLLLPLGKEILSNIENLCIKRYTQLGYREVSLPSIVPETMVNHLRKEGMFKFNNEHGKYFLAPEYIFPHYQKD
jgi:prolyl-tRNA synthetase